MEELVRVLAAIQEIFGLDGHIRCLTSGEGALYLPPAFLTAHASIPAFWEDESESRLRLLLPSDVRRLGQFVVFGRDEHSGNEWGFLEAAEEADPPVFVSAWPPDLMTQYFDSFSSFLGFFAAWRAEEEFDAVGIINDPAWEKRIEEVRARNQRCSGFGSLLAATPEAEVRYDGGTVLFFNEMGDVSLCTYESGLFWKVASHLGLGSESQWGLLNLRD